MIVKPAFNMRVSPTEGDYERVIGKVRVTYRVGRKSLWRPPHVWLQPLEMARRGTRAERAEVLAAFLAAADAANRDVALAQEVFAPLEARMYRDAGFVCNAFPGESPYFLLYRLAPTRRSS